MQLVGATKSFIRTPFVLNSIYQGIISALIAIVFISAVIYYLQNNLSDIINFYNYKTLGITYGIILLAGLTVTLISSFLAVNRYLRLRTSDLYF